MAKIINFEESRGIPVTFTLVGDRHRCRHPDFEILLETHEIRCRKCGQIIHPFDALLAYAQNDRMFRFWVAKYEAAKAEFEKIQSGWSLTVREKRRIKKAMDMAQLHFEEDGNKAEDKNA